MYKEDIFLFHAILNAIAFLLISSSTMASPRWMLSLLILGTGAITLVPAAQQFHDELLRSNLNNVARKKRTLPPLPGSPEYYNDLHSFKYHGDTDRKFDRDFDEDDEEIEFLPGGKVSREEASLLDSEKMRGKINILYYSLRISYQTFVFYWTFRIVSYCIRSLYC